VSIISTAAKVTAAARIWLVVFGRCRVMVDLII
jgi:hypothetical protein